MFLRDRLRLAAVVLSLLTAACGGGGGSSGPEADQFQVATTEPTGEVGSPAAVTAGFNAAVDPGTVSTDTFRVLRGGEPVAAVVRVADDARSATLTPAQPLTADRYQVVLTPEIRSATGASLRQATWAFSVAAPAESPLPLSTGKTWVYRQEYHNTVLTSTGRSDVNYAGQVVLTVADHATQDGIEVWHLRKFEINDAFDPAWSIPDVAVSSLALLQRPDRIDLATATGPRTLLAYGQSTLGQPEYLLVGGTVEDAPATQVRGPVSAPQGQRLGYLVRGRYSNLNQRYNNVDISDEREALYADGIGLAFGSWDLLQEDNNPSGIKIYARGSVRLVGVDTGPAILAEQEPNEGSLTEAQPISSPSIVSGRIARGDAHGTLQGLAVYDIYSLALSERSTVDMRVTKPASPGTHVTYLFLRQQGNGFTGNQGQRPQPVTVDAGQWYLMVTVPPAEIPAQGIDYSVYTTVSPAR